MGNNEMSTNERLELDYVRWAFIYLLKDLDS